MKKLIIISILYSSHILSMDHPFEISPLLDQLSSQDVEDLENIVHRASASPNQQHKELHATLACIKKIQTIQATHTLRKMEKYTNLLDYANTFVQNPQSISFLRTILNELKQSNNQTVVYDAWLLKRRLILNNAREVEREKSHDLQLLREAIQPYTEAGSEPRLRHILSYAEEVAKRAIENHQLLEAFQKQLNNTQMRHNN